jgi:hypothetical protein
MPLAEQCMLLIVLRPIGGTVGMDKLTPKGYKPESVVPMGRMGVAGRLRSS